MSSIPMLLLLFGIFLLNPFTDAVPMSQSLDHATEAGHGHPAPDTATAIESALQEGFHLLMAKTTPMEHITHQKEGVKRQKRWAMAPKRPYQQPQEDLIFHHLIEFHKEKAQCMQILNKILDFGERVAQAKKDGFFSLLWMAGKSYLNGEAEEMERILKDKERMLMPCERTDDHLNAAIQIRNALQDDKHDALIYKAKNELELEAKVLKHRMEVAERTLKKN